MKIHNNYSANVFSTEKCVYAIHMSSVELLMIDFQLRIIGNFIFHFIYLHNGFFVLLFQIKIDY